MYRTVTDVGGRLIFKFISLFWDVAPYRLVVANCIAWKSEIFEYYKFIVICERFYVVDRVCMLVCGLIVGVKCTVGLR